MSSHWPAELGYRLLGLLPTAATIVAEGAWVAVVYAAVTLGVGRGSLALGMWAFVLAAGVGVIIARRTGAPVVRAAVAAAIALAGLIGWASDPIGRDLLAHGSIGAAVANGSGLMLGFAVWRGTRHADPTTDDVVVGSLLAWAIPGLSVPWIIGMGAHGGPPFVDAALPETMAFVAAGLIAIGLTRLDALGRAAGVDWRRNRTWLALLGGAVGLMVVLGLPAAIALGASLGTLLATVFGPLGSWAQAIGGAVGPIIGGVGHAISSGLPEPPGTDSAGRQGSGDVPGWIGVGVLVGIGAVLVVGLARVVRFGRGGPPAVGWQAPPGEQRRIALPSISVRLPTPRLPMLSLRHAREPQTASEGYLALLKDLELDGRFRRAPAESAAGHARRLRDADHGTLALDLLAADFELERYAGVALGPRETARALLRRRRVPAVLRVRRSGPSG